MPTGSVSGGPRPSASISTRNTTPAVYEYVELIAGEHLHELEFWREAREVFSRMIDGHHNFEIAETFFNSIYCAVFKHRKIRNEYVFVFSPHGDMPPPM